MFELSRRDKGKRGHPIAGLLARLDAEHAEQRARILQELQTAKAETRKIEESMAGLEKQLRATTAAVQDHLMAILENQGRLYEKLLLALQSRDTRQQQISQQAKEKEAQFAQLQFLQNSFATELSQLVQRYRTSVTAVVNPKSDKGQGDRKTDRNA
jgi:chromosome segregation ATPase